MLEVRNIIKAYEGKPLLRGISFSVSQGETICLLGASGSGKSTLLRMIAGLENPESGHFLFNQIDLAQTPPHLRDFGLVFQDYGLFPHLNIFDNVAFGLKMKGFNHEGHKGHKGSSKDEINRRVAEMLALVNLTGFESRKVPDLSGGEQQRVALARALAPSPRLLMFDEPLGALDKSLKDDLLNQIRNILHQTKIPAIYVTHDQDEAFTIADRILLLHNGEIIRDGAPDEVWNNPNSIHAARMLGMGNIVEGRTQKAEGGKWKVESRIGRLEIACKHNHSVGEQVSLLVRQSDGGDEIKLAVEDVLFNRGQFQVKTESGLVIHMKNAPQVGEMILVRVKVECLA